MSVGFRLLAITPPAGAADPGIVRAWRGASTVGLAVLLREPGTAPGTLLDERHRLAALRRACTDAGIPWLVSVDAAHLQGSAQWLATPGLCGAQLRGDPGPEVVERARAELGAARVVGRSCHGQPVPMGGRVDYSVLAPIFAPRSGAPGKQPVGLEPLRAFTVVEPHVFALGGITPARARACIQAGAYGLAAIRSFFGPPRQVADDVARLVRALTEPVDHADPTPRR